MITEITLGVQCACFVKMLMIIMVLREVYTLVGVHSGKTNCAIQRTKFSSSKTDFVSIMTYFASRGNLELIKIIKPCKLTD